MQNTLKKKNKSFNYIWSDKKIGCEEYDKHISNYITFATKTMVGMFNVTTCTKSVSKESNDGNKVVANVQVD